MSLKAGIDQGSLELPDRIFLDVDPQPQPCLTVVGIQHVPPFPRPVCPDTVHQPVRVGIAFGKFLELLQQAVFFTLKPPQDRVDHPDGPRLAYKPRALGGFVDGCVFATLALPKLIQAEHEQPLDVEVARFERPVQELSGNPFQGAQPAQHAVGEVAGEGHVPRIGFAGLFCPEFLDLSQPDVFVQNSRNGGGGDQAWVRPRRQASPLRSRRASVSENRSPGIHGHPHRWDR